MKTLTYQGNLDAERIGADVMYEAYYHNRESGISAESLERAGFGFVNIYELRYQEEKNA